MQIEDARWLGASIYSGTKFFEVSRSIWMAKQLSWLKEASLCEVVNFVAVNAVKVLSWLRPNC
jgi:hypothetical protein